MIPCPDCGRDVSRRELMCPNCGLKGEVIAEPAKAGDAVVAPKQAGAQGFYKVWVSDAPIKAK